jgi:hypothetical protein
MTLEHSQQGSLLLMELPLMSSPEDSRAKTLVSLESKQGLAKEQEADCGVNASDLLASYDPVTQSLKTSQTCFLAQHSEEGFGLAEYSQTWPQSGMMRNGKIYQRQPWGLPIAESASGLWLTPTVQDSNKATKKWRTNHQNNLTAQVFTPRFWPTPASANYKGAVKKRFWGSPDYRGNLDEAVRTNCEDGQLNPAWVEWLMGYPIGHTELKV